MLLLYNMNDALCIIQKEKCQMFSIKWDWKIEKHYLWRNYLLNDKNVIKGI